mgnify:CR=1 FL=1
MLWVCRVALLSSMNAAWAMGASEAAARNARYALLEEYCGAHGILHLLVGHHRDDQSETQALRRTRGSGTVGRAGMPAVRDLTHTRILRPLLEVPRGRLTATLAARVPFLHFFDGFRTSHEVNKIEQLEPDDLRAMLDPDAIRTGLDDGRIHRPIRDGEANDWFVGT